MSKLKLAVNSADHHQGNVNAAITLVEYGDFECPHCKHAHPLIKRLLKERNNDLHFPLLADFEPKGAVSKLYGAYNELIGESKRALFVIDEQGVIQWSYLSPDAINPGADGILDALEELSHVK